MHIVIPGTTPWHTFGLGFDPTNVKTFRAVYYQDGYEVLRKEGADFVFDAEEQTAAVHLSQEDTLRFNCDVQVQVYPRALMTDGEVISVEEPIILTVADCKDRSVIE